MTLRIPDDEVSRPNVDGGRPESAPPPVAPSPAPPPAEPVMLMPMRIITINPTTEPIEPPPPSPPPSSAIPDAVPTVPRILSDESWTPLQPSVIDDPAVANADAPQPTTSEELIPIDSDASAADSVPESIEPDDVEPAQPTPLPRPPEPPPRTVAPSEPDGEEVRFDDDAPTPAVPAVVGRPSSSPRIDTPPPPSNGERRSDPGAELSADDVVDVEPAPPKVPSIAPPMRPRLQSETPGVPLPPAGKKGSAPVVVPPIAVPIKPPLVIVPPHVGTLAPQPTEGSGLRRKGRLWWEDLFNDDYLRTCEKLSDEQIAREVDFIEDSLGIERGGAMLDLACGTGRHAIELARRGYEVVGFDLSLAMLARAGEEAQDREAQLTFVQGDMREMTFEEQFDGVYCWSTSFGYFEEDKNAGVIDRIHKALRSGGLFLLDVANRDFLVRQSPSLAWFEGDGCVCMDEMSVDFITSRMKVKRTMMLDDGRSREIEYSMRIYSLHELGKILHEHGFKVTEVSGRLATRGVFFGNESPRTIILAEKR
jgi:SAM-dependent methyltransferase